ncbi:hypothetical protein K440DRAFT_662154 [Wilcoxina mikolae CBS 423.85]|nr:hypothetical protein K440DRAFT_662154 [Wilcoxina mikolae CBS 423.85]
MAVENLHLINDQLKISGFPVTADNLLVQMLAECMINHSPCNTWHQPAYVAHSQPQTFHIRNPKNVMEAIGIAANVISVVDLAFKVLHYDLAPQNSIRVLGGTERSITEIRNAQTAQLMNTGVTVCHLNCFLFPNLTPPKAAIVAQVTVTSIQLRGVDQLHWTVSAFWFCSLVLAMVAVFLSFLRHRDIVSLDNRTFRGLFVNTQQDRIRSEPKIRVAAVFLLCMPYMFLHIAITSYLFGLFLYLIFNWLFPGDSASTPTAVIANRNKDELDGLLNILHDGDAERFNSMVREREQLQDGVHTTSIQLPESSSAVEMRDLQQNGSLLAALAEAARAHTAAAAASHAVAREMERLQLSGIAMS